MQKDKAQQVKDEHYALLVNHLKALEEMYGRLGKGEGEDCLMFEVEGEDLTVILPDELVEVEKSMREVKQSLLRLRPEILLDLQKSLGIVSETCVRKMKDACLLGNKLMAVKHLKEDTGWGLKECKDIFLICLVCLFIGCLFVLWHASFRRFEEGVTWLDAKTRWPNKVLGDTEKD
jgi:hypothetical protein